MFKLMRIRHLLFCYYATFQTAAQCRLYLFRVELSISLKGEVCNMEKKDHYRLYKSGKRWLAALVVTVAAGAVLTSEVQPAQAAGTDGGAAVTAAEPAVWKTQLTALQNAVTAGNWNDIPYGAQKVSGILAGVKDEMSLNLAWGETFQAITGSIVTSNLPDSGSQSIFNVSQSTDPNYQGKTNSEALSAMASSGVPVADQPTPDFAAILKKATTYTKNQIDTYKITHNQWSLSGFVQAHSVIGQQLVQIDQQGTTAKIADIVAQAKDAASLANAWSIVAQAVITNELQVKLNLPDTTSVASKNTIDKFLAGKASGQTVTNAENFAKIIAQNSPTDSDPVPSIDTLMGNISAAVDTAVAATQLPETADWQTNKDGLTAFINSNSKIGQMTIKIDNDGHTATVSTIVGQVKDADSLARAWSAVAQAVLADELKTKMNLPDTTSDASLSTMTKLLNAKAQGSDITNSEEIAKVIAANSPSTTNPTLSVATAMGKVSQAADDAVANTQLAADWQINKDSLTAFVNANSKIGQMTVKIDNDDHTATVSAIVGQIKDADSLAKAWSAAVQTVLADEVKTKLGLPDTTSAESLSTITKFLDATPTGSQETNGAALAKVIAEQTPSATNPTIDAAAAMGKISDAVDTVAEKTQLPADWQVNKDNVTKFLKDNKFDQLKTSAAGSQTLADVVNGIKSQSDFAQAWPQVAFVIATHEAAAKLGVADTSDQVKAYLDAQSQVPAYAGKTNQEAFTELAMATAPGAANPTPNFGNVFADTVTKYVDASVTAQANWQKNVASLQEALSFNKLSGLTASANGETSTLTKLLTDTKDDPTFAETWKAAYQAVVAELIRQNLGLNDITNPANAEKIDAFLQAPSLQAGKTNAEVFQAITDKGTPTTDNPTPDYNALLATLTQSIHQEAENYNPQPTTENWQKNQAALKQYLASKGYDKLPESSGSKTTLADVVDAVDSDTSLNQAWATSANAIVAAKAQQEIDPKNPLDEKVFEALLAAPSTDPKYAGQTNGEVIADMIAAGAASATNPTPDYAANGNALTNYVDQAVTYARVSITVTDFTTAGHGDAFDQRMLLFMVGQKVVLTPQAPNGYQYDHVEFEGVDQKSATGVLDWSDKIQAGKQYDITYFYTPINQGGGGTVTPTYPTTPSNYEQAAHGEVFVKNPNGALLYSDMNMTNQISGRLLNLGTAWTYYKKVFDANGNLIGYNLGGQQYVKAGDVQETPVQNITLEDFSGVAQIVNGDAQVYSDAAMTQPISGQTLSVGSRWRAYQKVFINGTLAGYNLGGKQFVKAANVTVDTMVAKRGVFTVRYPANPRWSIAVYNENLQVQKVIPAGSHWQIYGVKTLSNGQAYYNLGGNQWVPVDYGTLQ